MKIIKKLKPLIASHIIHFINSIIYTSTYKSVLKVSKIISTLKQDKKSEDIDSLRPINNLSSVDTIIIIEQYLKGNIKEVLGYYKIWLPEHHGSRKNYSTMTALATIQNILIKLYDKDNTTVIIQIGLSAALDTIDHIVLLKKLDYYGIRGWENDLIDFFIR